MKRHTANKTLQCILYNLLRKRLKALKNFNFLTLFFNINVDAFLGARKRRCIPEEKDAGRVRGPGLRDVIRLRGRATLEPLIREKRHQQRHCAGCPPRLPTPLPKTRGGIPPQLPGVGDAPKVRRHGDACLHGAPCQGRNGPELRLHE